MIEANVTGGIRRLLLQAAIRGKVARQLRGAARGVAQWGNARQSTPQSVYCQYKFSYTNFRTLVRPCWANNLP